MTETLKKQRAELEFEAKLSKFLLSVREKAENQFKYGLSSNVPAGINSYQDVAQKSLNIGIVAAISKMHDYGIDESIRFAYDVLEDVNAHSEAKTLVQFIPEYQ